MKSFITHRINPGYQQQDHMSAGLWVPLCQPEVSFCGSLRLHSDSQTCFLGWLVALQMLNLAAMSCLGLATCTLGYGCTEQWPTGPRVSPESTPCLYLCGQSTNSPDTWWTSRLTPRRPHSVCFRAKHFTGSRHTADLPHPPSSLTRCLLEPWVMALVGSLPLVLAGTLQN